jgi:hypothetical protein
MKYISLDEFRKILRLAKMKHGWPALASIVRDVMPEAFVDFDEDPSLPQLPDDWREGLAAITQDCSSRLRSSVSPEEYQQELTALSLWLVNHRDVEGTAWELLDIVSALYTHWTRDDEIGNERGGRAKFIDYTCALLDLGEPFAWETIRSHLRRQSSQKTEK